MVTCRPRQAGHLIGPALEGAVMRSTGGGGGGGRRREGRDVWGCPVGLGFSQFDCGQLSVMESIVVFAVRLAIQRTEAGKGR